MLDTRQPSVDEDMRSLQLIYRVSFTELTVGSSPSMRTSERHYWEILACLLDSPSTHHVTRLFPVERSGYKPISNFDANPNPKGTFSERIRTLVGWLGWVCSANIPVGVSGSSVSSMRTAPQIVVTRGVDTWPLDTPNTNFDTNSGNLGVFWVSIQQKAKDQSCKYDANKSVYVRGQE